MKKIWSLFVCLLLISVSFIGSCNAMVNRTVLLTTPNSSSNTITLPKIISNNTTLSRKITPCDESVVFQNLEYDIVCNNQVVGNENADEDDFVLV